MICANRRRSSGCKAHAIEQPESEFRNSKNRLMKTCKKCRVYHAAYKKRLREGANVGLREEVPKFVTEGDKLMWVKWLRGLVAEARRCA